MHMANGLLDEAAESKTNEKSAATSLSFWLDVQSESHKLVLAGSSVGQFDRKFLERLDPMYPERQAMEYTDHRVLDVSTLDKLAEKLYPDIWNQRPEKTTNHRVFACIEDSMRLYAYYREHLLPKLGARECN
jgi:oligoribonuclease